MTEAIARCEREMAYAKTLIAAGHPDVEGLLMAIADWWVEMTLIRGDR